MGILYTKLYPFVFDKTPRVCGNVEEWRLTQLRDALFYEELHSQEIGSITDFSEQIPQCLEKGEGNELLWVSKEFAH